MSRGGLNQCDVSPCTCPLPYRSAPGAALRVDWVEEEEEVGRDLADHVQEPQVHSHVDPQRLGVLRHEVVLQGRRESALIDMWRHEKLALT